MKPDGRGRAKPGLKLEAHEMPQTVAHFFCAFCGDFRGDLA
jgi:hypothetical protein